jgi:uridine kinase
MEGIHCLNDDLTRRISRDRKHKIYISALTQLNLDDHNRIPTTDNRLVRRMVRDYQFRGHSALDTLRMWPSVRRGESRNIFPFQDSADAAFNSALDYELGVLKKHAEPLLVQVKPGHSVYDEAVRLLSFLGNFTNIPDKLVPDYSIVREFIGDSGFRY